MTNQDLAAYAALLLRVSLAVMFYAHAWLKIKVFTPAGTAKYFESLGVPGFLAYLTIAAEIGGGTLLLLGIETRWIALLLVPLIRRHDRPGAWEERLAIQQTKTAAGNFRRSGSSAWSSCPSWVTALWRSAPSFAFSEVSHHGQTRENKQTAMASTI